MKNDIYNSEKSVLDLGDRIGRNINRFARNMDTKNTFK